MGAVTFDEVKKRELESITARRLKMADPGGGAVPDAGKVHNDLFGVGLSGGGIRSATFNLGVLQGLAEHGVLPQIDYLSTVSGGGYIGSWLHGIVRRKGGLAATVDLLDPKRKPDEPSVDPIAWLRKYSNYLAPRKGFFSKDMWVLGSLWLRNFLLNQAVMIPAIAALLLIPVVAASISFGGTIARWYVAGLMLLLAVLGMGGRLKEIATRELHGKVARPAGLLRHIDAGICAVLICVACLLLGCAWTDPLTWPDSNGIWAVVGLATLYALLQFTGGFVGCFRKQHADAKDSVGPQWTALGIVLTLVFAAICAAVTAALLVGCFRVLDGQSGAMVLMCAPPLIAGALLTGVVLLIGLMGADYPDACREWLSRTGSVVLMLACAWVALFGIGIFVPDLIYEYGKTAVGAAGGWLTTTGAGLLAASSARTRDGGKASSSPWLERLVAVAPVVFLTGYLVLIAMGNHALLQGWPQYANSPWHLALAALTFGTVALLLGSRVNINEFSIHHLYKNRLVRCYLGASNPHRHANAWTGFDGKDDMKLADLRHLADNADGEGNKLYDGPYALVNTAVNLNSGSELATQDRKAASFFLSPEYCGFEPKRSNATKSVGGKAFVPSAEFMRGGPGLGTAMSISGAAANPNMGYHTSGPVAFLLTVFNIRLGWWVGNPMKGESVTKTTGPANTLEYLAKELLGLTTADTNYVNLSDGGHFDNLGIYELVRRKCRFVLIGDSEADAGLACGSLAEVIRRCRADFGVDIRIDIERIRRKTVHAVVGTIYYDENDTGTLVYIKSSVTGDEPQDVLEFQTRFADFPHQSTGDQFFDEAQFESYRQLGLHVAETLLEGMPMPECPKKFRPGYVADLFHKLQQRWYAPSLVQPGVASRHADSYSALIARLAKDPELAYLDPAFVPTLSAAKPSSAAAARRGKFFCIECIQLMENVFTDFRLGEEREWANPANRGWAEVFCHWAGLEEFQSAWKEVEKTYNCHFQEFFRSLTTRRTKAAAGCS